MKYYVNSKRSVIHGGKIFPAGKEFPVEALELGKEHVKVLLKEGSLLDERAHRKKFGPTEEELKAEAKAEIKAKAEAQVKIKAKTEKKAKPDKNEELIKVAAELGIKKADKMKEKELIKAIELAQADK